MKPFLKVPPASKLCSFAREAVLSPSATRWRAANGAVGMPGLPGGELSGPSALSDVAWEWSGNLFPVVMGAKLAASTWQSQESPVDLTPVGISPSAARLLLLVDW